MSKNEDETMPRDSEQNEASEASSILRRKIFEEVNFCVPPF